MTFETLSKKQKEVFQWWNKTEYKALICDGAVRSGKTICMITSYILWAMNNFNRCSFGICGKTVASAERNIIRPIQGITDINYYFGVSYSRSTHLLTVKNGDKENYFFVFGGKDESSYTLLQGITLSGIFLDEVALMPESFVNQAIARTLSEKGSRYWFNCNPESPAHWFYNEWILDAEHRNALHLHFLMSDNPTLDKEQIAEAERQFAGIFYQRYILGEWCLAEGLIYPMYQEAIIDNLPEEPATDYVLSIDYGTMNAFAALLWSKRGNTWYAEREYYYSGRDTKIQKTDEEYANDLEKWIEDVIENRPTTFSYLGGKMTKKIETIIDPSAASFIALLRKTDWSKVLPAANAVEDGIRETAVVLKSGKIKILRSCVNWEKEASGYVWDNKSLEDKPIKINDHLMDSTRYFVKTKGIAAKNRQYTSIM